MLLLVTGNDGSCANICGGRLLVSLVKAVLFLVATGSVVKFDVMLKKSYFIFLISSCWFDHGTCDKDTSLNCLFP